MIKTFKCKYTKLLFETLEGQKKFQEFNRQALKKLEMLNAAETVNDLLIPPANRLEKLQGNFKGYYSIRINNQWRVIFRWDEMDAYEVEIIDYH